MTVEEYADFRQGKGPYANTEENRKRIEAEMRLRAYKEAIALQKQKQEDQARTRTAIEVPEVSLDEFLEENK